jgi:AcrR family transcriptional regulator
MVVHEQPSSTPKRGYHKTKRAEDEQRTRARIVDAAEELHRTLGPSRTSVSAIAEHAAVTRATVYRHFSDEESLFLACSSQWLSHQRLPNVDTWTAHDDPLVRLRVGLTDIYRYYRSGEQMLTLIHRDAESVPPTVKANRVRAQRRWVDTLLQPFPDRSPRILPAAIGHAAAFETWRSLCVVQGLSNRSAVELMLGMVTIANPRTSMPHHHN